MAIVEDAASVLEQFVQDVANLPAEIHHILEEIEVKDHQIQECRTAIHTRDSSIQKHLKQNGIGSPNPKEEAYCKNVLANFDKAQAIQNEKVVLSEKASALLDRQIKRLDLQIRTLQNEGLIPPDPLLPSLLNPHSHNRVPSLSNNTTSASTPIAVLPPAPPSTTIANAAITRLVAPYPSTNSSSRHHSPALPSSTPVSGTIHVASSSRARESSSEATKRRRLNVPSTSSSLRQSSLGPNAPPKPASQTAPRAGSAGPRSISRKPVKAMTGPQRLGLLNPNSNKKSSASARRKSRKGLAGLKASPSDTGEDSALSEVENSESERRATATNGGDVPMSGVEEDDDGDGDDKKYCICDSVSYGNMVACDNEACPYEWFHWSCVGMTREPVGAWFCMECREKLKMK